LDEGSNPTLLLCDIDGSAEKGAGADG